MIDMKKISAVLLALMIVVFASLPAFAVVSPTKSSGKYKVTMHNQNGGSGNYTEKVDKDGQHVTLTAHPKNGYKFTNWIIDGKYTIVKGSLTDDEITVLLGSDIDVYPQFEGEDAAVTPSQNTSSKSPQTGDSTPLTITIICLSVLALGAVGVKLAVSKK